MNSSSNNSPNLLKGALGLTGLVYTFLVSAGDEISLELGLCQATPDFASAIIFGAKSTSATNGCKQ
jgi:hypothetical protein